MQVVKTILAIFSKYFLNTWQIVREFLSYSNDVSVFESVYDLYRSIHVCFFFTVYAVICVFLGCETKF